MQCYIPNWLTSSSASTAPRNDLKYTCSLQECENIELASVTIRSLGRHHRCLNTESVSLAFMDEDVSLYLEREMATALQKPGSKPPEKNGKFWVKKSVSGKI